MVRSSSVLQTSVFLSPTECSTLKIRLFTQKPSLPVENNEENMFEIPCSQDPAPSRFSSQRSILARTQSILSIQRQPKNYFESILIKCGVGMESMECYVLSKKTRTLRFTRFFCYPFDLRYSMQSFELCEQSQRFAQK